MKRNSNIKKLIIEKSGTLEAAAHLRVFIPARYENFNLCELGSTVRSCGVVAFVNDKSEYLESLVTSMLTFHPSFIERVNHTDGLEYIVLHFEEGSTICERDAFLNDNYAYELIKEFIDKGKIPFFLKYSNILEVFLNFKQYAGSKLGRNSIVFEALLHKIYRQEKDYFKYYREIAKPNFTNQDEAFVVGIGHNILSATTNFNRLTGTYLKQNLETAMIDKNSEITKLERVYRA